MAKSFCKKNEGCTAQKWSFLLKISSVNMDKSEEILLYWGNS